MKAAFVDEVSWLARRRQQAQQLVEATVRRFIALVHEFLKRIGGERLDLCGVRASRARGPNAGVNAVELSLYEGPIDGHRSESGLKSGEPGGDGVEMPGAKRGFKGRVGAPVI